MSKGSFLIKRLKKRFDFFYADDAYYEKKIAKFSHNFNYQAVVQDICYDIHDLWVMGNYDNLITYINTSFYDALTAELNLEQLSSLIKKVSSIGLDFARNILEQLLDACPVLEDIFSSIVGYDIITSQDIESITADPNIQKVLKTYCSLKGQFIETDSKSRTSQNKIILPKGKLLSCEKQLELIRAYKSGDEQALEKLIFAYTLCISNMAWSYTKENSSYEDLVQEGVMGVIYAVQNYDTLSSDKLSYYICTCIKNKMETYFFQGKYAYVASQIYTYDLAKQYLGCEGRCSDDQAGLGFWQLLAMDPVSYEELWEENPELLAAGYVEKHNKTVAQSRVRVVIE